MLTDIDDVLRDNDRTRDIAALGEAIYADAMASVRDLIDYGHDRGRAASYAPSSPPIHTGGDIATRLRETHEPAECAGQICILHNPTSHHMCTWPMMWRIDIGIFERMCVCGVGHPDPDQCETWERQGRQHLAAHRCDGCCIP